MNARIKSWQENRRCQNPRVIIWLLNSKGFYCIKPTLNQTVKTDDHSRSYILSWPVPYQKIDAEAFAAYRYQNVHHVDTELRWDLMFSNSQKVHQHRIRLTLPSSCFLPVAVAWLHNCMRASHSSGETCSYTASILAIELLRTAKKDTDIMWH